MQGKPGGTTARLEMVGGRGSVVATFVLMDGEARHAYGDGWRMHTRHVAVSWARSYSSIIPNTPLVPVFTTHSEVRHISGTQTPNS